MSKIYKKIVIGFIVFNFYFPIAYATETIFDKNLISLLKSSFVSSLNIGPSWESAGQAQTLNLTSDIIKTYTTNRPTNTLPTGELFLGIKGLLPKQLEGQIGLDVIATGTATLSGDIWDDGVPHFNNYTYQYKVSHTAVLVSGKLLGNWNLPVIPWISASLGVGLNKAYGFSNTPTIDEALPSPDFTNKTMTAFTYAIGIGAERQLSPHWQVGAGYEFSDWGRSQLGSTSGEGTNRGLSLSHLYTNSILFNLTYVA